MLFLRGQEISRADHVAFARRFGELEDHPVAGSDPAMATIAIAARLDQRERVMFSSRVQGLAVACAS